MCDGWAISRDSPRRPNSKLHLSRRFQSERLSGFKGAGYCQVPRSEADMRTVRSFPAAPLILMRGVGVREHYAEAFAIHDGCFRLVADEAGRPSHCPEPPMWIGTYDNGQGRTHTVWACGGHRGGLVTARRIIEEPRS